VTEIVDNISEWTFIVITVFFKKSVKGLLECLVVFFNLFYINKLQEFLMDLKVYVLSGTSFANIFPVGNIKYCYVARRQQLWNQTQIEEGIKESL
jgi:hypothetical protein